MKTVPSKPFPIIFSGQISLLSCPLVRFSARIDHQWKELSGIWIQCLGQLQRAGQ